MRTFLLISLLFLAFAHGMAGAAFVDNGDTVTDTVTCLQWQKATMDTRDGVGPDTYTWQEALAESENLNLAGHADWRLPDKNELRSLVDYGRYSPAIDPVFADSTQSSYYWSSTTDAGYPGVAWLVDFYYGYDGPDYKSSGYYVRAVRGGQCGNFGTWVPSGATGRIYHTPRSGPPGTTFAESGTGFTPNSTVTLHFRNHLGEEQTPIQKSTNSSGNFSLSYTAPFDKPIGTHKWWAVDDSTGGTSETIRYEITTAPGSQSTIPKGSTTGLPEIYIDSLYGTLSSREDFDTNKETFVIIHGWNTEDTINLPDWMIRMGSKIEEKGANVLYWNWQEKAKTEDVDTWLDVLYDSTNDPSCTVLLGNVPAGEAKNSGKFLALALNKALSQSYVASGKSIHFVGHSLGTFVAAHAANYADQKDLGYAGNINHMVFLDSPCLGDVVPGEGFLERKESSIFWENYISLFGVSYKGYPVDVRVDLRPKAYLWNNPLKDQNGHGYSHDWYESSVTNFTDGHLENGQPSLTMKWGFHWWQEDNRSGVKSDYSQIMPGPHYQLYEGTGFDVGVDFAGEVIIDYTGLVGDVTAEMIKQWTDWAKSVGKIIKIVGLKTYSTAGDATNAVVDTADHAFYNSTYGFLNLIHSSTAVLDLPVAISAEANALSFGTEFLYSDPGSILEVFINGKSVYHASSDQAMTSGLRMVPWIGVKEFAGQTVTLSLRLSNPNENTEGKIKIDDLVLAKIEDPEVPDGDVNNDGSVNLTDTVLALQVVSGKVTGNKLYPKADVNTDGKIGMAEAIYTLQKVAGLR